MFYTTRTCNFVPFFGQLNDKILKNTLFVQAMKGGAVMRKSVFGVSDKVRHKPSCVTTKMARFMKLRILEVEQIHCSESRGADQV